MTTEQAAAVEGESPFTCWCGVTGAIEEMFDDAVFFSGGCGGSGTLHCYCGGDFCVCHHHGDVECPGCDDCGGEDDAWVLGDDEDI